MIQMQLDARKLMMLAAESGMYRDEIDEGYYIHQQIMEMFGKNVFQTFRVTNQNNRLITILAYSNFSAAQLRKQAEEFASPGRFECCRWEAFAGKPMPASWQSGQKYRFEVKTCPVVRISRNSSKFKKGAEIDAFLAAIDNSKTDDLSREQVYKTWLIDQFARFSAAKVEQISLVGFKRTRLLRRTQAKPRQIRVLERPEAHLKGKIQIQDSNKFTDFLIKGIGRHISFGFGMILLKPEVE